MSQPIRKSARILMSHSGRRSTPLPGAIDSKTSRLLKASVPKRPPPVATRDIARPIKGNSDMTPRPIAGLSTSRAQGGLSKPKQRSEATGEIAENRKDDDERKPM